MPRLGGNEFRRAQLGDPTVANVPIAVMSGAADLEAARGSDRRRRHAREAARFRRAD